MVSDSKATKGKSSDKYTADQIVVLEGLEPVRKRPAMYIGSTSLVGVHHCITEIIDNSVDEALAGFAKNVWIIIHQLLLLMTVGEFRLILSLNIKVRPWK